MLASDYQRPAQLYFHGERGNLQRALQHGEFVLQVLGSGASACLSLSFHQTLQASLLQSDANADCCLVIVQSEKFGERLHAAVQKMLPNWVGIDGAVQYGGRSPLGNLFTKPLALAHEQEWLFAWRSSQKNASQLHPIIVNMGSIEKLAELREQASGSC